MKLKRNLPRIERERDGSARDPVYLVTDCDPHGHGVTTTHRSTNYVVRTFRSYPRDRIVPRSRITREDSATTTPRISQVERVRLESDEPRVLLRLASVLAEWWESLWSDHNGVASLTEEALPRAGTASPTAPRRSWLWRSSGTHWRHLAPLDGKKSRAPCHEKRSSGQTKSRNDVIRVRESRGEKRD